MVADWLLEAAAQYNEQSLEGRDGYPAHVLMPVETLAQILDWTFQSLPDATSPGPTFFAWGLGEIGRAV